MRLFVQMLAAVSFLASVANPSLAQQTFVELAQETFNHRDVARDANRYESYLKKNWTRESRDLNALFKRANESLTEDPRLSSRLFASAVASQPKKAEAWLGLAQALLAIKTDKSSAGRSERYDLTVNGSASAFRAYQLAANKELEARALRFLGLALERRSYWRPAIEALKTSLALQENAETRKIFNRLRSVHGFRMTDYNSDTEANPPRLCLKFSEALRPSPEDYAKFIAIDGQDPQSVRAEGRQLCLDGLKHGQRYEIKVRAGLPAKIGEKLQKDASIAVYLPDRKPAVRFTGKNYVLPTRGQQGIPVVSVNTDKVAIEVYRIGDRNLAQTLQNGEFQRQLSTWDLNTIKNRSGARVYSGEMSVKRKLNEDVTTAFPVTETIGALKPGVYAAIARPVAIKTDNRNYPATQWFIVSDLGLTAFSGDDGVHAFVRSLATTQPIANASVRLVAKNNEVLGKGKTDANGYVHFSGGLIRGEGGLQPAMIVGEDAKGGYAFLDMTTGAFDLSDRGVKGRKAPGPIDAYVFSERGVYRPGETVHLTALVRDAKTQAASLPVTMIVTRPDGVEHQRIRLKDQGLGGRAFSLPLAETAMTGTWRARVHTDPNQAALTNISFLVEDFVPERLDLTLKANGDKFPVGSDLMINAAGRFLYGPPAAGLGIEGEVIVKHSATGLKDYKGYQFGRAGAIITPVRENLESLPSTAADGKAQLSVKLPAIPKTAKPLQADVLVRLRESGGRTIERRVSLPVKTGQRRVGVKPLFEANTVGEGDPARFEVVHLDGNDNKIASENLSWTLYRLDTTWQWYSKNGSWSYEAVSMTRKVASGKIDTLKSGPQPLQMPVKYGRYRLEIAPPNVSEQPTSVLFNAGWYVSGDKADSPEILDVALDKPTYRPGDVAKLRIASRRGGRALISILNDGLLESKDVEVKPGSDEVALEVGNNWGSGVYVTAILYRAMDERAKRMPSRAVGVTWLKLDTSSQTLGVAINAPDKIRAQNGLKIPVKISGLEAGEEARVTIAAVDIGILNLTRFKTPSPEKWFYGQRRMAHEIRDLYGRLIDGMRAERGVMKSGGDGGAGLQMQGSPPLDETIALYSGIITVGEDGLAEADFELPNFNGSVRVYAIAWTANKLGTSQKDVVIRDPIALTASAPRGLILGDAAQFSIDVHNVEGEGGVYRLAVEEAGNGVNVQDLFAADLNLEKSKRVTERFEISPKRLGEHTYRLRVTGPNNIEVSRQIAIDVKPPANDIRRTTISRLQPGERLTLSPDIAVDMIASRTKINLSVGANARLDVPSLMTYLNRYPYGCAEQTVSKALPFIASNALSTRLSNVTKAKLRTRVDNAIKHLFTMQDSTGAFGAWGPSYTNIWLTSYVADFLTRAREQGYSVPKRGFNQTLDRLANFIAYAQDFEKGGENRAYALYVLARNGRAPIGELRYYADTRLSRFSTPLAKAQIGAALMMMGDKARAQKAFSTAVADINGTNNKTKLPVRADYGSRLRDGAALVTLISETGLSPEATPGLIDVIAEANANRSYTSTQEQAWIILAANALAERTNSFSLAVNGESTSGSLMRSLTPSALGNNPLEIENTGENAVDAVISVVGASLTPEPAISNGFEISRQYFTLSGEPVSMDAGNALQQNQRLIAVVTAKTKAKGGRFLLVDRLPSGLEIENPRLVESGDIRSIDWIKTSVRPEHTQFRDDRFVAAYDLTSNNINRDPDGFINLQVAYMVRAVTPGAFIHPAATIEDMYKPDQHARTEMRKLVIRASQ